MILGVTGHRKVINKVLTYRKILKYLKQENPSMVNVGGAMGFDSLVMRACYVLQIPYTLYLPHKCFVRNDYNVGNISYSILYLNASEVFYEAEKYHISNYQERNKKIVDNSEQLLIYWNGKPSGTANTVRYARWRNYSTNSFKNIY